ncbi:MBL fold metallo-hydrolase [Hymenobacter sediminis]|uniref:ComEC/Rec2 family competence protein n=1 Tax=Hymenobacter sediminis TaxID=2218621 RepID=UPI000DA64555|nr:MBL fold metallo-hydrolase [Hymenobacter sediminis]RPD43762.1 MBL fold metallo-hydrolase [Hymenobacter sediminis]
MPNDLYIRIWDVQHGSAAYVRTPEGRHMVVDLGVGDITGNNAGRAGDEWFSPLKCLRDNGITQLDNVIITHPHTDHVDDIEEFYNMNPLVLTTPRHLTDEEVLNGNPRRDNNILGKYLEIRKRYSAPMPSGTGVSSEKPSLDFTTFSPINCAKSNLNNQSIVVFLSYAGSTICIPGDPEGAAWRELLDQPGFIGYLKKTDILVASHHGRESGFCEDIFEHCKPKLVVISDGQRGTTCVREKYYQKATGLSVGSHSNTSWETRYCLTTRRDGSIDIWFTNDGIVVKTE